MKPASRQATSTLRKVSSVKQLAQGKRVPPGSLLKTKTTASSNSQHFVSKVQQALQNASLKRVDCYLTEVLQLIQGLKQNDELDLVLLAKASQCLSVDDAFLYPTPDTQLIQPRLLTDC